MKAHLFARSAEKFIIDNSPAIFTGMGVAGVVATAFLTFKATFKASEILGKQRGEDKKENFKLVWHLYIPAVATGLITISAIISANQIGQRRAAALAAAFSISDKAFGEYKEKVLEKFGEGKERALRDEIAQDRVSRNQPQEREVVITGNGDVLFCDLLTGRYFKSQMEKIRKAQNDINAQIIHDMYASLSDFYNLIGLSTTPYSEEVGWNTDRMLDIKFSTTMTDNDFPAITMDFAVSPVRGYNRFK